MTWLFVLDFSGGIVHSIRLTLIIDKYLYTALHEVLLYVHDTEQVHSQSSQLSCLASSYPGSVASP